MKGAFPGTRGKARGIMEENNIKLIELFNNETIRAQQKEIARLNSLLKGKTELEEQLKEKDAMIERKNQLITMQWELISSLRNQ